MPDRHYQPEPEAQPPFVWSGLKGFESALESLEKLFLAGRIPPAILFTGREGTGKSLFIRAAAASFFCPTPLGCKPCPSCEKLRHDEHPDILILEPKKGRLTTENAATARNFLRLKARWVHPDTGRAGAKVLVLTDVDRMTLQAANGMLKTLEEPPQGAVILMSSSREHALLPTILSRVVRWPLRPPNLTMATRIIREAGFGVLQGKELTDTELQELLRRYSKSPGKVIRALEQGAWPLTEQLSILEKAFSFPSLHAREEVCKSLIKEKGWSAEDLLHASEIALNRIYHQSCNTTMLPHMIKERRELLSNLHRMIRKQGIALNPRMMAEGLIATTGTS